MHHHCKLECIMKKQQKLLNYLDRPLTEIYAGRGRCALYTWSVFCRSDRAARGSSTESRSGRRTLRPHSPPSVGSVKTINIYKSYTYVIDELCFQILVVNFQVYIKLYDNGFS